MWWCGHQVAVGEGMQSLWKWVSWTSDFDQQSQPPSPGSVSERTQLLTEVTEVGQVETEARRS